MWVNNFLALIVFAFFCYNKKVWSTKCSSLYKFIFFKIINYKAVLGNNAVNIYSVIIKNIPIISYNKFIVIFFIIPYFMEFNWITYLFVILLCIFLISIYINEWNIIFMSEYYNIFIFICLYIEELEKFSILNGNLFMTYLFFIGIVRIFMGFFFNNINDHKSIFNYILNKIKFLWNNKHTVILIFITIFIINSIINYSGLLGLDTDASYIVSFFCTIFCKLNLLGVILIVTKIIVHKNLDFNTLCLSVESITFAFILSGIINFIFIPNIILPFYDNIVVNNYNNFKTIHFIHFSSLWKGFININKCLPISSKIIEILESLNYNFMSNRSSYVNTEKVLPIRFIPPRIADLLEAKKIKKLLPFHHKFPHMFFSPVTIHEIDKEFYYNDSLNKFLLHNTTEVSNVVGSINNVMFYCKEYCNINCYIKVKFEDCSINFSIKDNLLNMEFTENSTNKKNSINFNRSIDEIYNEIGLTNTNKDLIVFMNSNNEFDDQFEHENIYSGNDSYHINPVLGSNTELINSNTEYTNFNTGYNSGLTGSNLEFTDYNQGLTGYNSGITNSNTGFIGSNTEYTNFNTGFTDSNTGLTNSDIELIDSIAGLNNSDTELIDSITGLTNSDTELIGSNTELIPSIDMGDYTFESLPNQNITSISDIPSLPNIGTLPNEYTSENFYNLENVNHSFLFNNQFPSNNEFSSHQNNLFPFNNELDLNNEFDLNTLDNSNQFTQNTITSKYKHYGEKTKNILLCNMISDEDMNEDCFDEKKILIKLEAIKEKVVSYTWNTLRIKQLCYQSDFIENQFHNFVRELYSKHTDNIKGKIENTSLKIILTKLKTEIPLYIRENQINQQDILYSDFNSHTIKNKLERIINNLDGKGRKSMNITHLSYESENIKKLFFKYAKNIMGKNNDSDYSVRVVPLKLRLETLT